VATAPEAGIRFPDAGSILYAEIEELPLLDTYKNLFVGEMATKTGADPEL
jgi:hypothetical protein